MQINPVAPPSRKETTISFTVSANDIYTDDVDISSAPSELGSVVGFAITSTTDIVPMQVYTSSSNTIHIRVRNLSPNSIGAYMTIYYV